jgi:hypothetical protein
MTRRSFSELLAAAGQQPATTQDLPGRSTSPEHINRSHLYANQVGYLARGAKKFIAESDVDHFLPKFFSAEH